MTNHHSTNELEIDDITAGNSFTDPGGTVHTGSMGGVTGISGTASGDGSAVSFTLSHSLGVVPSQAVPVATTEDAMADLYVSAKTATDVTITYASPPPTGMENLGWDVTLHK